MNSGKWQAHAVKVAAIVAIVVVSNECYRYAREKVDYVRDLERQVATMSEEVRILKAQLAPLAGQQHAPPSRAVSPVQISPTPLPLPIASVPLPVSAPAPRSAPAKPQVKQDDGEVTVALMSEAKATRDSDAGEGEASSSVAVRLLGDAK